MIAFLQFLATLTDRLVSRIWNLIAGLGRKRLKDGLWLGFEIQDGRITRKKVFLPHIRRSEHTSITGITGTGKSYCLRSQIKQDIQQGIGSVVFDIHGDLTPFVFETVAAWESKTGQDLSKKLIVIDPSDPEYSSGFNVLGRSCHCRNSFSLQSCCLGKVVEVAHGIAPSQRHFQAPGLCRKTA